MKGHQEREGSLCQLSLPAVYINQKFYFWYIVSNDLIDTFLGLLDTFLHGPNTKLCLKVFFIMSNLHNIVMKEQHKTGLTGFNLISK